MTYRHATYPEINTNHLPVFARDWALFLDIDGTLTQLAATPDDVAIDSRVITTLERLQKALDGAVALITGRAIADADILFSPLKLPLGGQHGIERRRYDGRLITASKVAQKLDSVRETLAEFAQQYAGLVFEDKGETLALHYRGAPTMRDTAQWLMQEQLDRLGPEFILQRGKMVFEIRPDSHNKGTAIEAFMAEQPFQGRMPVFVGDDKTDEDGFSVVNRLGGHAIKVDGGATVARWHLANAEAVVRWLETYADFLEGKQS